MPEPGAATGSSQPIRLLALRARGALVDAGTFTRSRAIPLVSGSGPGRKWHLFADQPIDSTETCAISCAVTALAAVGDAPDSDLLQEALNTLLLLQLPSGGWTSWINNLDDLGAEDPEEALIVDTYFALYALRVAGREDTEPFRRGIEWFRRAHDAALGAWGFYPGDDPQILPTSMAIVALTLRGSPVEPQVRDVVNRGVEWLLARQRTGDGITWSIRDNRPGSAVHTAWALRALIAAGYDPYSPLVAAAREWLLDNTADRASTIDHYVTPGRTSIGRKRASRAITHINYPEGIIAHGLLTSGANLLDPRLLSAIDDLIRSQERDGYWRCLHAPREQPIYALMDACLALRLFVDTVARQEAVLEVSERVQEQDALVASLRGDVNEILANARTTAAGVTEMVEKLHGLDRRFDEQEDRLRSLSAEATSVRHDLERMNQGLVGLTPLMWLTRLIARWPVLTVLIVLQVVAYGLAAFTVPAHYRVLSWIGGGLLTIATAVTFWAQMRSQQPAPPSLTPQPSEEATHGS